MRVCLYCRTVRSRRALRFGAALLVAWLGVEPATAASTSVASSDPIEFTVLSYNTHGLPAWIARDDPESRFPKIGELTNGYDVALIQEDFAHHALLLEGARHPAVERGNGPRGACRAWLRLLCGRLGSGLTLLARVDTGNVLKVHRKAYERCRGWLWGRGDCLASKGLLYARLALAEGVAVDFYDTHLDAGREAGDHEVRAAQLERLRAEIEKRSDGTALIVGGDFNLAHEDPSDAALLRDFLEPLALRDSGARLEDDGRWLRRIDYLFYRSGRGIRLAPVAAGEAAEFADGGRPLSDHPAIYARFRVQRTP